MKKRILRMLMALVMLLSILPAGVLANGGPDGKPDDQTTTDDTNVYCYILKPGYAADDGASYIVKWAYAGKGSTNVGTPQINGGETPIVVSETADFSDGGNLIVPTGSYPKLTFGSRTYTYDPDGTKAGTYTITWTQMSASYGANDGDKSIVPYTTITWHGHAIAHIVDTDRFNVTFQAESEPGAGFALDTVGDEPAVYLIEKDQCVPAGQVPQHGDTTTHRFQWYLDEDCTREVDPSTHSITEDTTFYGKYVPKTFSIIYELSGGTNGAGNPSSYTYGVGVPSLEAAARTDYIFGGWFTEADFVNEVTGISSTDTGGKVLYAKWIEAGSQTKKLSYRVEYYKDGEKVDADTQTEEQTVGTDAADTLNVDLSKINTANKYEGFALDYTDPAPIPAQVSDQSVIRVYYATDEIGGTDGDGRDTGDGIPDKYQVCIEYVSADPNQGTVDPGKEVLTLRDANSALTTCADIEVSGATAAAESGYEFVQWIRADALVSRNAKFGPETIAQAEGGQTYTFTAHFQHYVPPYTPPYHPPQLELDPEHHVAYIIGYEDGTVRPEANITRAEVATIFFRLMTDASRSDYLGQIGKTVSFSDVDQGDWYYNAVCTLAEAGIVGGYTDGTFRPDAPITRAEFAAVVSRFYEDDTQEQSRFTDVPKDHWAAGYIALAEGKSLIHGYPDETFHPDDPITRAETMTLLNRVLQRAVREEKMCKDMVTWSDNRSDAWYYEAVQEATNSHAYNRTKEKVEESGIQQDYCFENWTEIEAVPDWAALEKSWMDKMLQK